MKKRKFKHLTDIEIEAISELKTNILKIVPNIKIIFYGSKVKGNFDKESDIDLAVIVPNLNRKLKYKIIYIATEIELKYDVIFGLVIISKEKYENSKLFKASLYYEEIKKEGLTV